MQPGLPFPVAFPYSLIGAARSPAARYERLLQCYEAVVRYCAAVQLSDYLAAGCPDPDVNRLLLERLGRNFSLGHWVELVRRITALQKRGAFPAFVPEMAGFYFKPGKGLSLTAAAEHFDTTLCAARNDWAHPSQTWSDAELTRQFKEHKGPLDRLLEALGFLARYPLYVPYRGPRPEVVSEAFLLMGAGEHPQLATEMNLPLAPQVREHLEYELTAFLAAPDDPARQLLLCPLVVFANRDGSEDLFLFEGCELRKQAVRRLLYRPLRVGQKPLEVIPGSDREALVRQVQSLLRMLGSERPAADDVPAEAVSAHYFAAQREIIEGHSRQFVGREEVRQALDRFLAGHRRGYFLVRGGPGQGKTAVACHLVREHGWLHHFVSRTGGRAEPRLILRSLIAQLSARVPAGVSLPDGVPELTKALEDLLAGAAARHKPLVLVVDALDELPDAAGDELPFLVREGLPEGVYVVVTSRPGDRLDRLVAALFGVPHEVFDLGPLGLPEMAAVLRASRPGLAQAEVERIADVCQGNPLYLRAVTQELGRNPGFDLRDLPAGIEGFFRRATAGVRDGPGGLLRDVLGLLAAARKPLSLRELAEITGQRQRPVHDQGVRPVRQFLLDLDGSYTFYHARFHEFVTRELLYEDEWADYHRLLAAWLQRPSSRPYDYRWSSLAYHLGAAGDRDGLLAVIDRAFLAEKVRRCGYAVLEDVELLSRSLLEAGDPALVERCVDLVEGLRAVIGGDIIENARQAVRGYRAGPASFRSRVIAPPVPAVPGLDVYVGMLPKVEVGADFFEVIPVGPRLVVAVGDAPGAGLKSAFVARFIGNVFRRLVEHADPLHLGQVFGELNRTLSAHVYFEIVSMQSVVVDPREGELAIASAGHPYPVIYSARRGKCERLPVRGDLLSVPAAADAAPVRYEQRRAEIGPGDVLVLLTDGLTEDNRLRGDRYSYRFTRLVEEKAGQGAKAIGEAILDDWRAYPRAADDADDVTVLVVAVQAPAGATARAQTSGGG
jgi:hypothetical protein